MKDIWNRVPAMSKPISLSVAFMMLAIPASYATTWQVDLVDNTASGTFTSLRVDSAGNGHVAYVTDTPDHVLKYGFWDHTVKRWFTMAVAPGASFCSLALDSKNQPHISYADFGTGKGAMLRYVHWDGSSWIRQGIPIRSTDVVAYYTSIALDRSDRPTISYYNYEGEGGGFVLTMRTVSWDGRIWEARTADSTYGSGKFNFIAADNAGGLHLVYANVSAMHAGLRYATLEGGEWRPEILEGANQAVYDESVALAMDAHNNPHIVYTDIEKQVVKYATRVDGKWILETVDQLFRARYPDRNGIAVDSAGNPYISYFDASNGVLKIAHKENGRWIVETIDHDFAGYNSSLQIADGTIWVTYGDDNGLLKCARRAISANAGDGPAALHSSLTVK